MRVRELTIGPIIGATKQTSVRLWGRGSAHSTGDEFHRVFGVAQLEINQDNIRTQFFKMLPKFDFTGVTDFKQLSPETNYRYRVGLRVG